MKEVHLGELTAVTELAHRTGLSATALVRAAFKDLGLLVTIDQPLSFQQAKKLLEGFGYAARPRNEAE